jgi:hypothetical protein
VSDEVRDSFLQSSEAMVGSFVELGEVADSLLVLGPFALVFVDLSEMLISAPVPASSVLLEEMPVSADTTETSNASDVSFDNPDSSGSLSEGFEMFVDFVHLVAEDLAPSASGSSAVAVLDTASEVTNSFFDNMFESSARSGAESLSHASDDSFLEVSGDSSCSSEGSFAGSSLSHERLVDASSESSLESHSTAPFSQSGMVVFSAMSPAVDSHPGLVGFSEASVGDLGVVLDRVGHGVSGSSEEESFAPSLTEGVGNCGILAKKPDGASEFLALEFGLSKTGGDFIEA